MLGFHRRRRCPITEPPIWETLTDDGEEDPAAYDCLRTTSRMPVPGGWLYRYSAWDGEGWSSTMAFVPDKTGQ